MAKEYQVIEINERKALGANNRMAKYFVISARSAGGVGFTLDLTEQQAVPAEAKKLLTAKAKQLDDVKRG